MSCEEPQPFRQFVMMAILPVLALYGLAIHALVTPHWDEAYRRTFVTGEFGVYPLSVSFNGKNALDVGIGETIDLSSERGRLLLSRFDWRKFDPGIPFLVATEGTIFIHRPERPDAQVNLSLDLTLQCGMATFRELDILLDGQLVWSGRCEGDRMTLSVPFSFMGEKEGYSQVTFRREGIPLLERWAIRLGLRYNDFAVRVLRISARPPARS